MNTDKAQPLVGIVLSVASALLVVGVLTFAGPCAAHGDGSAVVCGGAARAVLGAGVVALVLSLVRIFERDEGERRGLCLGIALVGVLIACMPGFLVELCGDQAMRCNAIMLPFCRSVGVVVAIVAAADLTMRLIKLVKH